MANDWAALQNLQSLLAKLLLDLTSLLRVALDGDNCRVHLGGDEPVRN